MTAQTMTIISGVVLVLVFALVGYLGHRRDSRRSMDRHADEKKSP